MADRLGRRHLSRLGCKGAGERAFGAADRSEQGESRWRKRRAIPTTKRHAARVRRRHRGHGGQLALRRHDARAAASGTRPEPAFRESAARQATLESFTHHEACDARYFAGFAIPADEVDNFDDAVADGRASFSIPTPARTQRTIAAAFKAAGLRNVRAY